MAKYEYLSAVDPSTIEFGNSLPPYGPHTITFHMPGWQTAMRFKDGDTSIIGRLKSIYPRFAPFGLPATLCQKIAEKLDLPKEYICAAFVSPDVWASNKEHAISSFRKEKDRLQPAELRYYVVEIAGVRLYVLGYPSKKSSGAIFQWQHGGLGFSSRVAEALIPHVESMVCLGEFPDGQGRAGVPEPTYFEEGDAHAKLRERIADLMMRACATEHEKSVTPGDVYLYQTGMAAVTRLHEALVSIRPGEVVVFGAVFHSTFHLFEECEGGIRHYGMAADEDVDAFETWLEMGGECSFVITEFPSNPSMVCVNLMRLRALADKYGFYLVVDDTCASIANIDVLAAAHVIVTSLTKSFSGYADVMAGSVVLNPNAGVYGVLKKELASRFHNEFYEADAAQLLENNADYLARCAIHNRNAAALATFFHARSFEETSPVTRVWYPPYSPGSKYLESFMRKPTDEFPEPGFGCLFSVEFDTVEHAAAFYDHLNFFCGPHLGAHLSLAMPYNSMVFGKENPELHAAYGLVPEQIRIAVGMEDGTVLVKRCQEALGKIE